MSDPPRVLVTGCLGHIGSALVRQWAGVELVGLDNLASQRYAALWQEPRPRLTFLEGDVLAPADYAALLSGFDAVVHLAALTDAAGSTAAGRADEYHRVNAVGTQRVGEACLRAGVPLVLASTTSVYGPQPPDRAAAGVDEGLHPDHHNPQTPYAASKLAAEELLRLHLGPKGLRYTTLRFGTIYGPSPGMRFHTAVNRFCWQAAQAQPLTVWAGAWDARRPYCDLRTAVGALRRAALRWPRAGRTFNIVTGHHTVGEVVGAIRRHLPATVVATVDAPPDLVNQEGYTVGARVALRALELFPGDLEAGVRATLRLLRPDVFDVPTATAAAA